MKHEIIVRLSLYIVHPRPHMRPKKLSLAYLSSIRLATQQTRDRKPPHKRSVPACACRPLIKRYHPLVRFPRLLVECAVLVLKPLVLSRARRQHHPEPQSRFIVVFNRVIAPIRDSDPLILPIDSKPEQRRSNRQLISEATSGVRSWRSSMTQ
jgi:hypothetical protein